MGVAEQFMNTVDFSGVDRRPFNSSTAVEGFNGFLPREVMLKKC